MVIAFGSLELYVSTFIRTHKLSILIKSSTFFKLSVNEVNDEKYYIFINFEKKILLATFLSMTFKHSSTNYDAFKE